MRKLYHIDKTKSDWKEKWLEARKKSIGASDIAGVVGLNPYKSPLWIYLDKTSQLPESYQENIAAELGLELENFMRKKFVKWMKKNEDINIDVKEVPYILQHDKVDYFTATLDGILKHPEKGKCILEIKTTTEFKRELWQGDEVPDEYYTQVQWQLMVTGWQWAYLVYLIGNRTFDVKLISRNEGVIENLANKGTGFWTQFVEKNIPPAPIGFNSDTEALKILYPEENQESGLDLTDENEGEVIKAMEIIDEQKAIEKVARVEKTRAQQIIKATIGDNEYMLAGGRKITYKTIAIAEHMVKASQYRKLHIGKK